MRQQTIAEKVTCKGAGLHSGKAAQLVLSPARADSGIVFVRTDIDPRLEVPARSGSLASTYFATTLRSGRASIGTVEHILSAVYGLGIDNIRIEIDGPELPVMDGSAAIFVSLIRRAGLFVQRERRRAIRILRPIEVLESDRSIRIEPAARLGVSYEIDFAHPAIGAQEMHLDNVDADRFENEIAGARTFGFLKDVAGLRDAGLALGGTLENTIVLDDEQIMNEGGLRWPDEFVRHKILDLLGDLALLGTRVLGHVKVERGGHTLHHRLVSAILSRPECWQLDHVEPVTGAFATNPLQYANSR